MFDRLNFWNKIVAGLIVFAFVSPALSQQHTRIDVTGVVVDAKTNQPLEGAHVEVKGSTQFASTNDNGEFRLRNVIKNSTLLIRFVGYRTEEVTAGGNTRMRVGLEQE